MLKNLCKLLLVLNWWRMGNKLAQVFEQIPWLYVDVILLGYCSSRHKASDTRTRNMYNFSSKFLHYLLTNSIRAIWRQHIIIKNLLENLRKFIARVSPVLNVKTCSKTWASFLPVCHQLKTGDSAWARNSYLLGKFLQLCVDQKLWRQLKMSENSPINCAIFKCECHRVTAV